jgi:hypothetical protein
MRALCRIYTGKVQPIQLDTAGIHMYIHTSRRGTVEVNTPCGCPVSSFESVIANPRIGTVYRNPLLGTFRYDGRCAAVVGRRSRFRMESEKARDKLDRSQDRLRGRKGNSRRPHFHPPIGSSWRSQVPNLRISPRAGSRGRLRVPRLALLGHLGTARASRRTTKILQSSPDTPRRRARLTGLLLMRSAMRRSLGPLQTIPMRCPSMSIGRMLFWLSLRKSRRSPSASMKMY